MDENYHTARTDQIQRRLAVAMLVNAAFAGGVIMRAEATALLLVDPIRWATWTAMSSRPDLFEFPFVMLWAMPVLAVGIAWVLKTGGALRVAVWVSCFPLLYLGTLFGCYHVLPRLGT